MMEVAVRPYGCSSAHHDAHTGDATGISSSKATSFIFDTDGDGVATLRPTRATPENLELFSALASLPKSPKVLTVTGDNPRETRAVFETLCRAAERASRPDSDHVQGDLALDLPPSPSSLSDHGVPEIHAVLFPRITPDPNVDADARPLLIILAPSWSQSSALAAYHSTFNLLYVSTAAVINWEFCQRFELCLNASDNPTPGAGTGNENSDKTEVSSETSSGDESDEESESEFSVSSETSSGDGSDDESETEFSVSSETSSGDGSDDESKTDSSDHEDQESAIDDNYSGHVEKTGEGDASMHSLGEELRLTPPVMTLCLRNFTLHASAEQIQHSAQRIFKDLLSRDKLREVKTIVSKPDDDLSSLMMTVLRNLQSSKWNRHDRPLLSATEYAYLLHAAVSMSPTQASLLDQMQCKRADDMVTEYVSLYSEEMHGVEDKEEYYDRSDFLKHHTQIANKVLRDFIAELESLPVFASVDSRRKHVLSLSKEIRRRQQHLASVIDRKSKERNMAIADAEWKVYVDSISKQVLLGTGLKAARCLVKLIDSFARAYMRQAKGPSKLSHMMRFLEGKGSWINSVISLSKLYDEIAKDELRQLEEIQRVVKDYKIIEALFVSEAASAMSMQINAELEIVLNQVPLTVENAAAVINAQLTETQNDLAASFAVTTEQINTATQQGIANAQAELDASLGEMRQMQNTLSEAQQVTEAAATDLANKKPALPAWLQGLIGGAITLAGVALTALTGGAGAVIGGMLISAGMSATMQSFSGAKVSLEDFGKGVGIGLATGLVTAGFGAAAGAAIKCATQAFVETGKSVLTSMATSAIISATSSCASNVLSTVIDNACNPPRPIGQGLATAAVIGAVGGAIGGAVSGFSSHTKYAAKLKQAAQLKEAIDVAPKAAIPAMKTLGKSAKQMLVSTAEGSANGVVGAAIGAGMTGQDAGSAIAQGAWQGAFGGAVGGLTQAGRNFRKRHVQNQKLRAAEAAGKLQQDGTYPITIITDPANGNQHIDHSNLHIDGLISDTEQMARISLAIDQDTTRAGVSVPPPDRPRWLQKRDPATGGTLMTNDAGQPAFGRHARTSNSSAFFNVGVQQRAVGSVPAGHHGPYNVPRLDTPNYPWYRVDKFMTRLGRDRYTFGDGVKNVGLKDKPKFQKINNLKEARVAHLPNLTSHPKFPSNLSKFSKLADQYCAGVRTRDMIKPVVQNVKKTVVQNVKKADKDD